MRFPFFFNPVFVLPGLNEKYTFLAGKLFGNLLPLLLCAARLFCALSSSATLRFKDGAFDGRRNLCCVPRLFTILTLEPDLTVILDRLGCTFASNT